jgi:hypothetical protein
MTRWRRHSPSSSSLLPARVSPGQLAPQDQGGPARQRLRPRRVSHPSQLTGLRLPRREGHQLARRQPHPALTVDPISLLLARRTLSERGLVPKECKSNRLVGCPQRWSRPTTQRTNVTGAQIGPHLPDRPTNPGSDAGRCSVAWLKKGFGRACSFGGNDGTRPPPVRGASIRRERCESLPWDIRAR